MVIDKALASVGIRQRNEISFDRFSLCFLRNRYFLKTVSRFESCDTKLSSRDRFNVYLVQDKFNNFARKSKLA